MRSLLSGLGLIVCVSFLDIHRGITTAWAYDLPAAQTAYQKKDYQKTVDLLSPEVEKLDRKGLFLLAGAYSRQKKPTAAIKVYTAAFAKNPKDVEAKTLIGVEQINLHQDNDALQTLKDALNMDKKYLPAYNALISIYEKRDNKYELRLLYQDMIKNIGERPLFVAKLCELTTEDGLYDLAFSYCERGMKIDPKEPSNFVNFGLANKETGNTEQAEGYLKKAAMSFPKSELAQYTYGKYLADQKNFIGAYPLYKKAVAADEKSSRALLGLAQSSFEIQKYAESLTTFSQLCSLDKTSLPFFRRAANSLRTMKIADWLKKFEDKIDLCEGSGGF
jgi:tetratricopeptide (TPR) repeat protein